MKQPFEIVVGRHSVTVLRVCRALLGVHDADDAWSETVGNPRALCAVGVACVNNPPVVVPCHRVLRADGSLGGYIGGHEAKTTLLELEAAA